jgi:hypothetical protein
VTGAPIERRRIHPQTYLFFLVLFGIVVFVTHLPFLSLPYYWDELGQFVPAALDLYTSGALIPHSTVPNVHPPGFMAYLAACWTLAGCSPLTTRVAVLLLASIGVLIAFLLAIELCRNVPGTPAFLPVLLLCVSPLFYAQAMLAQLDMPAMLLTSLALLLFLQDKMRVAAIAATALVLVKETGLIVPVVFAGWLLYERRAREAAWFMLPCAALGVWLGVLAARTGHLFGNSEFTRYNLYYTLHPVRLVFALARRLYYLFFQDFHWIGTVAMVFGWRKGLFSTRAWHVGWLLIWGHVLFLSVVGGAMLERYLLPVLPIVYSAMVAATCAYRPAWKAISQAGLLAGLIAGNFWNPPYPFPLENNLAFTDFVAVQRDAAQFLERRYSGARVATAWPLTSALSRPAFGYVNHPLPVLALRDFTPATIDRQQWADARVFVLFSRTWEPALSWTRIPWVRDLWTCFYGYQPELTTLDMRLRAMLPVAHWSRRGQWIEIYEISTDMAAPVLADRSAECSGRPYL